MNIEIWVPAIVAMCTLVSQILAHRKLDHITVLTNSTLSAANARIVVLEREKRITKQRTVRRQSAYPR